MADCRTGGATSPRKRALTLSLPDNNDLRHPVLVAREAATVDLLTDGRLELGLGAGSIKSEYDEAGFSFDPGGTRVERLAASVTIIKSLLNGEQVTSPVGTIA
jgi:alkanesulfonate monooxygenase SsuD/methylene tetrahydromethanopterin reductase-like flavin-dependent oxidoreductase (luciferase family)